MREGEKDQQPIFKNRRMKKVLRRSCANVSRPRESNPKGICEGSKVLGPTFLFEASMQQSLWTTSGT